MLQQPVWRGAPAWFIEGTVASQVWMTPIVWIAVPKAQPPIIPWDYCVLAAQVEDGFVDVTIRYFVQPVQVSLLHGRIIPHLPLRQSIRIVAPIMPV